MLGVMLRAIHNYCMDIIQLFRIGGSTQPITLFLMISQVSYTIITRKLFSSGYHKYFSPRRCSCSVVRQASAEIDHATEFGSSISSPRLSALLSACNIIPSLPNLDPTPLIMIFPTFYSMPQWNCLVKRGWGVRTLNPKP